MLKPELTVPQSRVDLLHAELDERIASPGFDILANHFGVALPAEGTQVRLNRLTTFAADKLDFRLDKNKRRLERCDVNWERVPEDAAYAGLTIPGSEEWNTVFDATRPFGMVDSTFAQHERYDIFVGPGAANLAPLHRLSYGLKQPNTTYANVVMLGCGRTLEKDDPAKIAQYASGAQTEHDLNNGAIRSLFQVVSSRKVDLFDVGYDHREPAYVTLHQTHEGDTIHSLYSPAPVHDTRTRANSIETLQHLRAYLPSYFNEDNRLLLSTNALYLPQQHMDALLHLTLPTGIEVDGIGFDAAYGGVIRKPSQLLQEVKAYIDSMGRLSKALGEVTVADARVYL